MRLAIGITSSVAIFVLLLCGAGDCAAARTGPAKSRFVGKWVRVDEITTGIVIKHNEGTTYLLQDLNIITGETGDPYLLQMQGGVLKHSEGDLQLSLYFLVKTGRIRLDGSKILTRPWSLEYRPITATAKADAIKELARRKKAADDEAATRLADELRQRADDIKALYAVLGNPGKSCRVLKEGSAAADWVSGGAVRFLSFDPKSGEIHAIRSPVKATSWRQSDDARRIVGLLKNKALYFQWVDDDGSLKGKVMQFSLNRDRGLYLDDGRAHYQAFHSFDLTDSASDAAASIPADDGRPWPRIDPTKLPEKDPLIPPL